MADFVGSTAALLPCVARARPRPSSSAPRRASCTRCTSCGPDAELIPIPVDSGCNCSLCPYMKLNTLEKLYLALRDLRPEIELDEAVRLKALVPGAADAGPGVTGEVGSRSAAGPSAGFRGFAPPHRCSASSARPRCAAGGLTKHSLARRGRPKDPGIGTFWAGVGNRIRRLYRSFHASWTQRMRRVQPVGKDAC